jgi:hypothetical protein
MNEDEILELTYKCPSPSYASVKLPEYMEEEDCWMCGRELDPDKPVWLLTIGKSKEKLYYCSLECRESHSKLKAEVKSSRPLLARVFPPLIA